MNSTAEPTEPAPRLDFSSAGRIIGALFADEPGDEESAALPTIGGYTLIRELGRGGGGQVFLGSRAGSRQDLAIKLLNASVSNRSATDRVWRELDLLSDLDLAGVPAVHDYGIADGRVYIVTAHVEGLTLADHCEQNNLDTRQRVELLVRVSNAVQRLHEHGVMHRDIKPDNIIVNRSGEPVIIDFGIAVLMNDAAKTLTLEGTPIGSPAFMAPEQARGERSRISTRSDVYGLGATACLVLTGHPPHDVSGPLHAAIRKVADEPARDPARLDPSLPKPLAAILRRALSAMPEDRYPTAEAFADDLRRWLDNKPIDWQRPGFMRRTRLAWRRDRRAFIVRAAVGVLLLASFASTALLGAQWRVAEHERSVLARENDVLDQERVLRQRAEAFAQEETRLKEHYHKEAVRLDEAASRFLKREQEIIELRKRQIALVQKAKEEGDIFGATIILANLAQDLESGLIPDEQFAKAFLAAVMDAAEAARQRIKQDQGDGVEQP